MASDGAVAKRVAYAGVGPRIGDGRFLALVAAYGGCEIGANRERHRDGATIAGDAVGVEALARGARRGRGEGARAGEKAEAHAL